MNAPSLHRRILALDPFLEGSHLDILEGWKKHSQHTITIVGHTTGPWHWRMRHGAISLAREIRRRIEKGEMWDAIFATSMLHLGELKSLLPELRALPCVIFFHENQLTYPQTKEPDPHLIFNQFIGSLCADQIWYNSQFHLVQHHDSLRSWLKRMPPPSLLTEFNQWKDKCKVVYPGVDLMNFEPKPLAAGGPLNLLWSARWEDDKDPATFVEYIEGLVSSKIDLKLFIMGCQPSRSNPLILKLEELLKNNLSLPGFLESRASMMELQQNSHLHVSTTLHEFFGLSVMESALMGRGLCLPRRLSYPELYGDLENQDDGVIFFNDLREAIAKTIAFDAKRKQGLLNIPDRQKVLSKYTWEKSAEVFDENFSTL